MRKITITASALALIALTTSFTPHTLVRIAFS